MTNEERINLRERALRLAYEFPIENTGTNQSWADDIYDYLVKDIDPAEISEPEKSRNEWKHVSEISPSEYQRIHADLHGIDWSRPQLVVSEDDDEFIVRTTGLHGFDEFQGYSDEDGDIPDWYKKKHFKYSGEIPQEQDRTTIIHSTPLLGVDQNGYAHERDGIGCAWEPIRNAPTEDEHKEGLNFLEAITACKSGKNIRRSSWNLKYTLYHSNFQVFRDDDRIMEFSVEDFLATDWQIVK